jgi:hypothetical protein
VVALFIQNKDFLLPCLAAEVRPAAQEILFLPTVYPQREAPENPLTILAVEEVAHRSSPSLIRFRQGLAFVCVHALFRYGFIVFGFAARRAAVRKAGLIRL